MGADQDVIRVLRNLQPNGTAKVIRLQWNNPYFELAYIQQCVDELERMFIRAETLQEQPNALERLGMMALLDLIHFDPKDYEIKKGGE